MNSTSTKGDPTIVSYPRTFSFIVTSVCGLAIFIILGSVLLVSQPIGTTVRGYFYGVERSSAFDSLSWGNNTIYDSNKDGSKDLRKFESVISGINESSSQVANDTGIIHEAVIRSESVLKETKESVDKQGKEATSSNTTESIENAGSHSSGVLDSSSIKQPGVTPATYSPSPDGRSQSSSVTSGCDLYHGKWVYDSTGPLYTNNTCPVLSQMQNCQGNGRPDKDYENWRWKPAKCDLPKFDPKKFLELMRGKTLAFIGDSVSRNQMESLLCILWQAEVPKNRGNKRMQRYYFRSTSTMIVRIWSSWLVHQTSEPFDFSPVGVTKLHLDKPDEGFFHYIPTFDVIVLSSGHWFAKRSVYILNNEIVGGQLWWPDKSRRVKINNIDAFGVSVETILTAIVRHPNYTGLTIVRSFSPDHYEGGAWNTGGSCTGKEKPLLEGELVENGFTNIMHEKQQSGFNSAIKKKTNKSKLIFMDITEAFGYRHDGHPGPYRSPDPNKITKRGPDGRPPPQDCLHWCMPGPVDTWNELVLEIIRRDFEGNHGFRE
ncbi:hypothetical protein NMG60_11018200 [Bertholletia excelsa]